MLAPSPILPHRIMFKTTLWSRQGLVKPMVTYHPFVLKKTVDILLTSLYLHSLFTLSYLRYSAISQKSDDFIKDDTHYLTYHCHLDEEKDRLNIEKKDRPNVECFYIFRIYVGVQNANTHFHFGHTSLPMVGENLPYLNKQYTNIVMWWLMVWYSFHKQFMSS